MSSSFFLEIQVVAQQEEAFCVEEFNCNNETDRYVCPAGRYLKLKAKRVKNTGNLYRQYAADQ
ncbi:MAG: hypothetical protein GTO24_08600 [candidate division Zixibacteria bacterium]|nr:hypothetical protein [candidate division Zixibacteria bacterium]